MQTRFINIEYEETAGTSDQSYSGVTVTGKTETFAAFRSGDPVEDWKAMRDWVIAQGAPVRYMYSSSVDHFVMDSEGYRWIEDDAGREMIVRNGEPVAMDAEASRASPDASSTAAGEPAPELFYRPNELDDWGMIRDGEGRLFAVVRRPATEEELERHRKNGTDPYEDMARRLMSTYRPPSAA